MIRTCLLIAAFGIFVHPVIHAKEGMWIPLLLDQINYADLQQQGFELTPNDIYSINQLCLADAVVQYNGGCTGSIISKQGLLLTNYHCAYSQVQKHSSLEHDYLTKGFWAHTQSEELPNPGVHVKILRHMSDVSEQIFHAIEPTLPWATRDELIKQRIDSLERKVMDTSDLQVSIESFYAGHKFYLFLYEVYNDIRLVGVPSSAIGKFGGDTDNWMWPRHSADFALLRIYTSPSGEPAKYSEDNIPLTPRKYLTITKSGYQPRDPTLVMGYPAHTQQYLYSASLANLYHHTLPALICIRSGYLAILKQAMAADDKVRIQYAKKHDAVSNSWKKWAGTLYGFDRVDAIAAKRLFENNMRQKTVAHKSGLEDLYTAFENKYQAYQPFLFAYQVYNETFYRIESVGFLQDVLGAVNKPGDNLQADLRKLADAFFKDYDGRVGEKSSHYLIGRMIQLLDGKYLPAESDILKNDSKRQKLVAAITEKSIFTNKELFDRFVLKAVDREKAIKWLKKDVLYQQLYVPVHDCVKSSVLKGYDNNSVQFDSLYHQYHTYLRAVVPAEKYYPDANRTLRIAYGQVKGYLPTDAVGYNYHTTTHGIFEKLASGNPDYYPDSTLLSLLGSEVWADSVVVPTFIANNHTTGGNSGSPVLNKRGELIGLNFDRTWESTMSDYYFNEDICRNVMVDIRYILFIMEHYGNCAYLLDEMEIVGD